MVWLCRLALGRGQRLLTTSSLRGSVKDTSLLPSVSVSLLWRFTAVRCNGTAVGRGMLPTAFSVTAPNLDTKTVADIGTIPEPPLPLSSEQMDSLQLHLGSQLEFLGLGNWTPSGLVQILLTSVHDVCGLPWWCAILSCTVIIRMLTTPLLVYSQRNSAAMNEFTSGMTKINEKLLDARKRRDKFTEEMLLVELQDYIQNSKGTQLYLRMFGISMAQGSLFLTYFIALRGMSYAPVLSMKDGGISWFTDLTLSDPTWILPIYSAATVALILELGLETGMSTASISKMKWVFRLLPVVMLIFIKSYPSAMLFHWCISNTYSLLVALLFQIPVVRRAIDVPPLQRSIFTKFKLFKDKRATGAGLVQLAGVEESQKAEKTLSQRVKAMYEENIVGSGPSESKVRQLDAQNFSRAGKHAPPPTFPYNPTEQFPAEFRASKRGWRQFFAALWGGRKS